VGEERRGCELRQRIAALEGELEAAKEEAQTVRTEWANERQQAVEQASDGTLARAVFTVAYNRQRGDLVSAYLSSHESDADVFEELRQIPDAESREKAIENVEASIPAPMESQVKPVASITDVPDASAKPLQ